MMTIKGKKISDAQSWLHIQFSLIDTRPLHGMADVCEKHNIKLLTYGTFVRIAPTPASPSGLSYYPPSASAVVFWQMLGSIGPSPIRTPAR
jgi:hypothetical protein